MGCLGLGCYMPWLHALALAVAWGGCLGLGCRMPWPWLLHAHELPWPWLRAHGGLPRPWLLHALALAAACLGLWLLMPMGGAA